MKTYCVYFGTKENFLRCSCLWFRRNHSLCKHFFAIIDSGYREFEDLTPLYRNHSLHTIDADLFKSENDDTPLVRKILLFQRLISIVVITEGSFPRVYISRIQTGRTQSRKLYSGTYILGLHITKM